MALSEVYFLSVVCLFSHRPTPYRNGNNTFLGGKSVEGGKGKEGEGHKAKLGPATSHAMHAMHSLDRQAGARIPVWGSVSPLAIYIQYAVNTYRISLLLVEGED